MAAILHIITLVINLAGEAHKKLISYSPPSQSENP